MSRKATVRAPSNIAFIKYWGTRDVERTLPFNPSISMTLSNCVSVCTVEHRPAETAHEVLVGDADGDGFEPADERFAAGVTAQLDRLSAWAGVDGSFHVATRNSFPTGAGMASSASGFAALTLAVLAVLQREVSAAEASRLARLSGSGSAARSVLGGYVEWPVPWPAEARGADGGEGSAEQIAEASHWDLCDVVAVVDSSPKEISSRQGHARAPSSPYWPRRLEELPDRLKVVREAIRERDPSKLGPVIEGEAVDMHLVAMSSQPPILYWTAGTFEVLRLARELRERGVATWATIDAGPNVHLICEPKDESSVVAALNDSEMVESVIVDRVGAGPEEIEEHLA